MFSPQVSQLKQSNINFYTSAKLRNILNLHIQHLIVDRNQALKQNKKNKI